MKEKLEACFERLQHLNIMPTQDNMEKLLQTLYDLKSIYNELKEGERHDGPAADPGGSNND